jgi:hypothetical protein
MGEDLDVGGTIILKRTSEKWDGVVWTGLIWLRNPAVGSCEHGDELSDSIQFWEILFSILATDGFLETTQLHGS